MRTARVRFLSIKWDHVTLLLKMPQWHPILEQKRIPRNSQCGVSYHTPHSSVSLWTLSVILFLPPQLQPLCSKLLSISSIPLPMPFHSFCPLHLENSTHIPEVLSPLFQLFNTKYHFVLSWKLICVCICLKRNEPRVLGHPKHILYHCTITRVSFRPAWYSKVINSLVFRVPNFQCLLSFNLIAAF